MNSSSVALDIADDFLNLGTDDEDDSDDSDEANSRDENEANDARHEAAFARCQLGWSGQLKMRNSQSLELHGECG